MPANTAAAAVVALIALGAAAMRRILLMLSLERFCLARNILKPRRAALRQWTVGRVI
jgi:hypothetical protein